jgi:flavorubredoxin
MHAVVVYESHWGNTAAVARAIAEGIGPEAVAVTTDQATAEILTSADMIVAGAPVLGFRLATGAIRKELYLESGAPSPADTLHPSMGSWLESLPSGHTPAAAFETRFRFSPGGAIGTINLKMERAGYKPIAKGQKFLVTGKYGPLKSGELDRARQWGAELATAVQRDSAS